MDDIYREYIIELYKNPRNFGKMDEPDLSASMNNPSCGDSITLYIRLKEGRVESATFSGQGCAISQASASLLTDFLKGKTEGELRKISREDVLALLKIDLSKNPTRMRCALLPLDALRKALKDK